MGACGEWMASAVVLSVSSWLGPLHIELFATNLFKCYRGDGTCDA
jgi:hypothetical protein